MLGRTTRLAARLGVTQLACASFACASFACASLASCSSDDTASPASDGGSAADATDASAAPDSASVDAEGGSSCDVGALPAMPPLASEVLIDGVDGGAAPAPSGGDEDGLWTYTKITIFLPPNAQGQIDPSKSKVEGKGFIELRGGKLRQFVDTTTVLATAAIGTVTRAGVTKVVGTYAASGTSVTFAITCRESTAEASTLADAGFSRIDATHALLHITSMTQIGTAKLVIDLQRQP